MRVYGVVISLDQSLMQKLFLRPINILLLFSNFYEK